MRVDESSEASVCMRVFSTPTRRRVAEELTSILKSEFVREFS